uniref:Uncharacterized protein n=1 Tax=Salix viminalis TaxID=40686 RepID=A0A6N2MRE5_SALVM
MQFCQLHIIFHLLIISFLYTKLVFLFILGDQIQLFQVISLVGLSVEEEKNKKVTFFQLLLCVHHLVDNTIWKKEPFGLKDNGVLGFSGRDSAFRKFNGHTE